MGDFFGDAFGRATSVPKPDKINTQPAWDASKNATISAPATGPSTTISKQTNAFDGAQAGQATTDSSANPYLQNNLEMLQKMAAGQAGSVAQNQLDQGRQANIAATMAQANSQRGGFNPMLARQALQSGATQNAQANQQAAQQRLQEQMAATGQISQQGTAMRGQDIGVSTSNAQMQSQASLATMQAQLQQAVAQGQMSAQQANLVYQTQATAAAETEKLRQQYMAMGMNADQANIAAQQEYNKQKTQKQAAVMGGITSALMPAASFMGMGANPKSNTAATPTGGGDANGGMGSQGQIGDTGGGGGGWGSVAQLAKGGVVPGRAPKEGDHPENDIVPARLSPGEFVLPRSLTQDKELMQMVHKKMAEHQVKQQHVTASQGFAEVLKAHADLNQKMEALKKHMGGY